MICPTCNHFMGAHGHPWLAAQGVTCPCCLEPTYKIGSMAEIIKVPPMLRTCYFMVHPPDGPSFLVRTTRRGYRACEEHVREQFPESTVSFQKRLEIPHNVARAARTV